MARVSAPASAPILPRTVWRLPAVLTGWLLGTALQLQQAALWPLPAYAGTLALALAGAWVAWRQPHWRALAWLLAAAAAFGLCGLRAGVFLAGALAPTLQGQDLRVTGVVAVMPQERETGLRLRLQVESAQLQGAPVRVPPLIDLTWYARGQHEGELTPPPAVRAGERWRLTVRLKAPHGARNPHGFDYELWLWSRACRPPATCAPARGWTPSTARHSGWAPPGATLSSSCASACAMPSPARWPTLPTAAPRMQPASALPAW